MGEFPTIFASVPSRAVLVSRASMNITGARINTQSFRSFCLRIEVSSMLAALERINSFSFLREPQDNFHMSWCHASFQQFRSFGNIRHLKGIDHRSEHLFDDGK